MSDQTQPTCYSPRLVKCDAAQKLADLAMIEEDLRHVVFCCERVLAASHDEKFELLRALSTSAFVAYRRCFRGGARRLMLTLQDLEGFDADDIAWHEAALRQASQSYAHAVDETQNRAVGISIGVREGSPPKLGGLWNGGVSQFVADGNELSALAQMARHLYGVIVPKKMKEQEAALKSWLEQYSAEEILTWPDALSATLPVSRSGGRKMHNQANTD